MRPLAILCSDLHFSHTAPAARSVEDWYAVQARYIDQLAAIQSKHTQPEDGWPLPVIVAGDIFDRWTPLNSPAELISFLIAKLPDRIFAIPGQHDLPFHEYAARHRSPYWTLAAAQTIFDVPFGYPQYISYAPYDNETDPVLIIHAFPWGHEITPFTGDKKPGEVHLAVVHAYIWGNDFGGYPGAPDEQRVEFYRKKLEGYDAAVFGDNHEGRLISSNIINCGTFLRRKVDERHYRPMIGVLYSDGHIEPHYLDVSADLWLDDAPSSPEKDQAADTSGVVAALKQIGADALDFRSVLYRLMDQQQTTERVRSAVVAVVS